MANEQVEDPKTAKRVLHIAMPTRGAISVPTHCFLQYYTTWGQRAGFSQMQQHLPTGKSVVESREECVNIIRTWRDKFPDLEHWVLWMDDDMDPPMSSLAIMRAEMEGSEKTDKPIGMLTGLCSRKEKHDVGMVFATKTSAQMLPVVDYNPGEIVEVQWCGLAFSLMRADWFEKISRPYFQGNDMGAGEDNYFVNKLRDVGCVPYVHTGLSIGHFDIKVQHNFFAYTPVKVRSASDTKEPISDLRLTRAEPSANGYAKVTA
jgi:hypothetical protein